MKELSVEQLVQRFADFAFEQDKAQLGLEIGKLNRLFWKMEVITEELKARPGDQQRALLTLYAHPNMQVRLKAAKNSLAVAPVAARKLLEEISASRWQPQAGEAGMSLSNLDAGIFKPT